MDKSVMLKINECGSKHVYSIRLHICGDYPAVRLYMYPKDDDHNVTNYPILASAQWIVLVFKLSTINLLGKPLLTSTYTPERLLGIWNVNQQQLILCVCICECE